MSVGISWGPAAAKLGLFKKFTMFWAMDIIVPTFWTGFSHKYYASPYQTRLDKNLSTKEWKHSNIWESLKIKAFYIVMNYAGIFNSPEMEDENQNGSLLKRNSLYDSHSIISFLVPTGIFLPWQSIIISLEYLQKTADSCKLFSHLLNIAMYYYSN